MIKVLSLPRFSLALGVAALIISVALACGDSGDSSTLLEENFWLNASVADVRTELDRGADINARYISDLTPLHYAARENKGPVIALLLDRGADIHGKAVGGGTPLHYAALGNEESAIALLLDRGAAIHARTDNGLTPLHWAAWENEEPAVIELLLDRGADIHARDNIGYTACQLAGSNIDIGTEVLHRLCR